MYTCIGYVSINMYGRPRSRLNAVRLACTTLRRRDGNARSLRHTVFGFVLTKCRVTCPSSSPPPTSTTSQPLPGTNVRRYTRVHKQIFDPCTMPDSNVWSFSGCKYTKVPVDHGASNGTRKWEIGRVRYAQRANARRESPRRLRLVRVISYIRTFHRDEGWIRRQSVLYTGARLRRRLGIRYGPVRRRPTITIRRFYGYQTRNPRMTGVSQIMVHGLLWVCELVFKRLNNQY